jgi:hypothetical protein
MNQAGKSWPTDLFGVKRLISSQNDLNVNVSDQNELI